MLIEIDEREAASSDAVINTDCASAINSKTASGRNTDATLGICVAVGRSVGSSLRYAGDAAAPLTGPAST